MKIYPPSYTRRRSGLIKFNLQSPAARQWCSQRNRTDSYFLSTAIGSDLRSLRTNSMAQRNNRRKKCSHLKSTGTRMVLQSEVSSFCKKGCKRWFETFQKGSRLAQNYFASTAFRCGKEMEFLRAHLGKCGWLLTFDFDGKATISNQRDVKAHLFGNKAKLILIW